MQAARGSAGELAVEPIHQKAVSPDMGICPLWFAAFWAATASATLILPKTPPRVRDSLSAPTTYLLSSLSAVGLRLPE